MSSPGFKPIIDPRTGEVLGPRVDTILADPRYRPTLREGLALGVGKAHRGVAYSHFDHRNHGLRGGARLGTSGKL